MDRLHLGRCALLALDLPVVTGFARALVVGGIDEEIPSAAMRHAVVHHRRRHHVSAGQVALAQRLLGELREPRGLPDREAVPEAPGARPAPLSIEVALARGLRLLGCPSAGSSVDRG